MMPRPFERLHIRKQFMLFTGALMVAASVLFVAISYNKQRAALLRGIDERLRTAARLAELVPREGYFDRIEDRDSVSEKEYLRIVDRNNRLCIELGLQYLWSCMLLDGQVVFTTATSPGKDAAAGDHASFLEVHRDPHAFDKVFATMRPDYSSFLNEWGHGRMVLVPHTDSRGRPYCVGASVGVAEIHALLRHTLSASIGVTALFLCAGLLCTLLFATSLSRPIVRLTNVADNIAHGRMDEEIQGRGSAELHSLAASIKFMRDSIRNTISALQVEIAERRQAQDRLSEHRAHLEDMVKRRTAELQRSNEELERFAYVASHDLQEPLRKIAAFGNLLDRDASGLSEQQRDYITRMQSAARRMQRFIEDLLSYSRVTTQARPFERVDLNRLLAEILSDLEPLIRETGGRVDAGPLPELEADPMQMRQLMQNLVSNGLKFHKEDVPPEVKVSCPECDPVSPDRQPQDASEGFRRIVFRDNGIGFDEKFNRRIFGIFERLHGPLKYAGSGIGLAVCKKIVDRHGGFISAEGRPGQGAAFTVTLPLRQDLRPAGTGEE